MRAALDYISLTLNPDFTLHDWYEYANSPVFNEDTGEIMGVRVSKKLWKVDRIYDHIVLSAYGKATEEVAFLARHFGCTVTRIDICLDIPEKGGQSSEALKEEIADKISAFNKAHKRKTKRKYYGTQDDDKGGSSTITFGARSSDSQVRLYSRSASYSQANVCRIEFQLRDELAKSAWNIISAAKFKETRLRDVLASLEAIKWEQGLLGIDWANSAIYELDRSKDKVPSSRKDWFIAQVLPAAIKEFAETGENLAEFLLQEFNNHFEQQMLRNQQVARWTKDL